MQNTRDKYCIAKEPFISFHVGKCTVKSKMFVTPRTIARTVKQLFDW